MRSSWNPFGFRLHEMFCFVVIFIFLFGIRECRSVNLEGLALLDFRANVHSDPYAVFINWNPDDIDPCMWSGVYCKDGKVQILDVSGLYLEGTLAPGIGKLKNLQSLVLHKNHFTGAIPKEFGELTMLEVLDLSSNNLSGTIPAEIRQMHSLKRLLLSNNQFNGRIPLELGSASTLSEVQFDRNLTFDVDYGLHCLHRKLGHCIWQKGSKESKKDPFTSHVRRKFKTYVHVLPWFFRKSSLHACGDRYCESFPGSDQHLVSFVRRKLIQDSTNLPALPAIGVVLPDPATTAPPTISSGSFPAVPSAQTKPRQPDEPTSEPPSGGPKLDAQWILIIVGVCLLVLLVSLVIILCVRRRKGAKHVGPNKTGISGKLEKAFVTGVPQLTRSELETACEDFSNIVHILDYVTIYKGTLSNGVEVAVASTNIKDLGGWSTHAETAYRKKIEGLSRVNHKNFVNLVGYCEEDEPFSRMMVFEYAPSGSLFDRLHVKEYDHLDWSARMRAIMGVAYCLQHIHELNPPIFFGCLRSNVIFFTDDNAAKVVDLSFWKDFVPKSDQSGKNDPEHGVLPLSHDAESNVYCFGIMLLEVVSGKLRYSEKEGSLLDWASERLGDEKKINNLIDPTLKTHKENELAIVCEVIKECIHPDTMKRPTMREVVSKLREVIAISPEAAMPRTSPLWWAELEILSVEAG